MFSKNIGIKEYSEAEVLIILEALRHFRSNFHGNLVVESDSTNAISWVSSSSLIPWRFHFFLNEIKALALFLQDVFRHVGRLVGALAV